MRAAETSPPGQSKDTRIVAKKPSTRTGTALGEPSGRLLALSLETNLPEPYEVSDTITVQPPSKLATEAMNDAHMRLMVYQSLLAAALSPAGGSVPSDDDMKALAVAVRQAEDDYNRAFFGDAHDDVLAFFAHRPTPLWDAFVADIKRQFLPHEPADGKCRTCGSVVDAADAEGKPASST